MKMTAAVVTAKPEKISIIKKKTQTMLLKSTPTSHRVKVKTRVLYQGGRHYAQGSTTTMSVCLQSFQMTILTLLMSIYLLLSKITEVMGGRTILSQHKNCLMKLSRKCRLKLNRYPKGQIQYQLLDLLHITQIMTINNKLKSHQKMNMPSFYTLKTNSFNLIRWKQN